MAWFKAASVTATNGSKNVIVNSSELIDNINDHDSLLIEGFNGRDIATAYTDGPTQEKRIELVDPWPHADQIAVACQVQPTAVNFNEGVEAMNSTREKIVLNWTPLQAFGNQASGTVTFTAANSQDQDVTIRCLNQFATDIGALEQSAIDATEDLQAVDDAINAEGGLDDQVQALSLTVSGIDETLQGYVQSCSDDAEQTGLDRIATGQDRVATGDDAYQTGQDRIATGQDKLDCDQAVIDAQAAQEAAEQAAENAENIAGGTAPDSNKLGGKLANVYYNSVDNKPTKATVELDQVDNTSDANKEISIATLAALGDKLEADDLIGYATIAELEDIEALALAGL